MDITQQLQSLLGTGEEDRKNALNMGLLQAGLGILANNTDRRNPMPAIAKGGMMGLQGYQQSIQQSQADALKKIQMAELVRQLKQREEIAALAKNSVVSPEAQAIGKFGPTPQGAAAIGSLKPKFDTEGFLAGMMGVDPLQALQLQQSLAPKPQTVGKNDRLVVPDASAPSGFKTVLDAQPDLPQGMRIGANGKWEYDPAYLSGQQAIRAAGKATNTSVVNMPPMETEESKAVGKDLAQQYTSIQSAGFKAQSTLNNLKRMEQLMSGVSTGKLAGVAKELASVSESLGIKIDPKLGDKEAIEALSNEMALLARGDRMPGAMSDQDRTFLQSMVPGLVKTPEGNKLIIETMRRLAKRDQQIAKMAAEYRTKNKTLNGFTQELQAWSDRNPLFADIKINDGRSSGGRIGGGSILDQADAIVGR